MKAGTSLRIAVSVPFLVCLCLLTGCSLLSSDDTSSTVDQESSSAEAQKAVENARKLIVQPDDLDKARVDAEQARTTANKLKDRADKMTADTISDHKDPNNASAAPKTYKAIQDSKNAEEEARSKQQQFEQLRSQDVKARRDLDQANAAVAAAKQRESSNVRRSGTETDGAGTRRTNSSMPSWAVLLTVFLGLSALLLLFWLTWRLIDGNYAKTERLIQELEGNRSYRSGAALSELKAIKAQLTEVQTRLARLTLTVQNGQERQVDERTGLDLPVTYYEPPVEVLDEDPWQFPTSAGALLTRLGGQSTILKPDPLKGILVKDPEGRGQLVLLENQRVPGGQFYIIPRITRFQTKEDFYNHYEQFYGCNRPEAGEVWLYEPAVVDKIDGGWHLIDKGQLEVR